MPKVLLISSAADADRIGDQVTLLATRRAGNVKALMLHANPIVSVLRDLPLLQSAIADSDIMHAFGSAALSMAVLLRANTIVYTPTRWPNGAAIAWLRAAMAYRSIQVICESDTLRREYVTHGVPADRCTIVRPGVSMAGLSTSRDDALRASLGIAPDDRVVLAPLPIGMGDHTVSVWAVSLMNVVDSRVRLIVPSPGPDKNLYARVLPRLMDERLLIVASDLRPDVSTRSLYGAADLVLLAPTKHARSLDIVTAMASQRPIVSTLTPHICEFLEDRHTALLSRQKDNPQLVARRMMDAFEDPTLMHAVADRARVEVYEHFTVSKTLEALDAVYAKSYSTIVPARSNPTPA